MEMELWAGSILGWRSGRELNYKCKHNATGLESTGGDRTGQEEFQDMPECWQDEGTDSGTGTAKSLK